jgi:hypothetical protein
LATVENTVIPPPYDFALGTFVQFLSSCIERPQFGTRTVLLLHYSIM